MLPVQKGNLDPEYFHLLLQTRLKQATSFRRAREGPRCTVSRVIPSPLPTPFSLPRVFRGALLKCSHDLDTSPLETFRGTSLPYTLSEFIPGLASGNLLQCHSFLRVLCPYALMPLCAHLMVCTHVFLKMGGRGSE